MHVNVHNKDTYNGTYFTGFAYNGNTVHLHMADIVS